MDDEIVQFDELEGEKRDTTTPKLGARLAEALTVLKGKLKPEDYANIATLLGVKTDLTNADLLAAIEKLVKPCDEPVVDEKKKREELAGNYKEFVKTCMKDGKSLADCAVEWKKKYPEPAKAMGADFAALDAQIQKVLDEEKAALAAVSAKDKQITDMAATIGKLQISVDELTNLNKNSSIKTEVDKLVTNHNISPAQHADVLKLAAGMPTLDARNAFLNVYRKQKLTVTEDVGEQRGASNTTPERKKEILKNSGLAELINEKGSAAARKQLQDLN